MTTIHTRQLQQYTQDNYNNAHKTTNNNTHKTTTTMHTRQLTTIHTRHLRNTTCTKGKQHHGKKVLYTFSSIFFHTHTVLRLSPQPFTSHHFTTHINFSHKVSFLPLSLHCTSLHFISLHYTSLPHVDNIFPFSRSVNSKWQFFSCASIALSERSVR